ncbi:polysaccharide pyruvyl transferase family protein [Primorskyibacter sp. S187A]|uniref:polysaccharide pyruvyl transferase family protein n=1 Tax=Primorskyibacter sp. S187A TaxID=3415130 RepID=UPI003C7EC2D4
MSSTKIHAEIAGVWLPNKGAELMAITAISELRARLPGITFCSPRQGPDAARAALGMDAFTLRENTFWHRAKQAFPKLAEPRAFRAERPGVTHVIDASGFAYGDAWGPRKARKRAHAYIESGLPTYLLPQAFGPFEDTKLRKHMKSIVLGARKISARDEQSLKHLNGLETGRDIPLIPDITLGLSASDRNVPTPDTPFAAVVVNAMLLKSGALDAQALTTLYKNVLERIAASGVTPKIVLHEPQADLELSSSLAKASGTELIALDHPLDIKAYIANAKLVVTARFHGLANGLSSGVPSFAIGWSHKYAELLEQFGTPDMLYQGDHDAFLAAIDTHLASEAKQAETRATLLDRKAVFARKLTAYWDDLAEDMLRQR